MQAKNKTIVVTGGGSGIGRELVLALVKEGATVAALDINEKNLQETRALAANNAEKISLHVLDISDRAAVEAFAREAIKAHGAVDGLINNAGIIQPFVRLNDLAYADIDRVLNVNLYGVIYMTKAFLPHLLQRPEAHIVNVSSMGGFFPVPGQTLYGASKAAVKLLTEGLYSELLETNVHVTAVFPGAIATNISENSGVAIAGRDQAEAESSFTALPADEAAAAIIEGMERNEFQIYVGRDAKMMNIFYRLSPRRATLFMYKQMKGLLQGAGSKPAVSGPRPLSSSFESRGL
ncbi:MAG: SDR family NAD(P)-dependent oxidoreductase [Candidatus Promineifilaceae bacterium]|jgi:short-subunit dehydrogenase